MADVLRLPDDTVDCIMNYYVYDNEINEILAKVETDLFHKMYVSRKTEVLTAVKKTVDEAIIAGKAAIEEIELFLTQRGLSGKAQDRDGFIKYCVKSSYHKACLYALEGKMGIIKCVSRHKDI